jgi:hypothetical protein
MDTFDLIALGNKAVLAINLIFLLYSVKHLSKTMVLLMVLLFIMLGIDLAHSYLADHGMDNAFLTHYYTVLQFIILSVIYFRHLKRFQIVVPFGVIGFFSFFLYQLLSSSIVYDEFNTTGFLISTCILLFYAFFYYIEHITEKNYWDTFNVGLFLYLGGSSIIFLTMNNWAQLKGWNTLIWTVNALLAVLYQVFIFITIYRYHRLMRKHNGNSSV